MTRYIDWSDVAARHPSIGVDFDATQVNSTHIPYIETQVDGLLAPAFTVPFSNNNLTVKDLCIELTYIRMANLSADDS